MRGGEKLHLVERLDGVGELRKRFGDHLRRLRAIGERETRPQITDRRSATASGLVAIEALSDAPRIAPGELRVDFAQLRLRKRTASGDVQLVLEQVDPCPFGIARRDASRSKATHLLRASPSVALRILDADLRRSRFQCRERSRKIVSVRHDGPSVRPLRRTSPGNGRACRKMHGVVVRHLAEDGREVERLNREGRARKGERGSERPKVEPNPFIKLRRRGRRPPPTNDPAPEAPT
jgi:hypothetical protein